MISGVAVDVIRPMVVGVDRFGEPTFGEPVVDVVRNVLVSPGATADLDSTRPEGASVAFSLHFPKSYKRSLRGCGIRLPEPWGGTYRVIGDPQSYDDANTPTIWNRPVEVEAVDG